MQNSEFKCITTIASFSAFPLVQAFPEIFKEFISHAMVCGSHIFLEIFSTTRGPV